MGAVQDYEIQSYSNVEINSSYNVTDASQSQELAALTGLEHTANKVKTITFDNFSSNKDAYVVFAKDAAPTATTAGRKVPAGMAVVFENVRYNYFALICAAAETATVKASIQVEGNTG
jgi:hypothetical protein